MVKQGPPTAADHDLEQLSSLFRLLSDKTRLSILLRLAGGERNVTNLCEELRLPQPTVSHHLGLLRMNNIVANRRHGKQVFYALNGSTKCEEGKSLQFSVASYLVRICDKPAE